MKAIKEKGVYQSPTVEVNTLRLDSTILVGTPLPPGGGEDPGDENWAPGFLPNIPSIFNSL